MSMQCLPASPSFLEINKNAVAQFHSDILLPPTYISPSATTTTRKTLKSSQILLAEMDSSSMAPWARLPLEIKSNIMGRLTRIDLKSCRLLDKCTSLAATRVLFQTLCLSPSMNSVDRLSKVAARPDLASQVRTLEIHRHYLKNVPFDEYLRTGHLSERLQRLPPLDAASLAVVLSQAYEDELDAQGRFLDEAPPLVVNALKKFPRLQCFVHGGRLARTEEGDFLLDEHSDLLRRTGVRTLSGGTHFLLMHSVLLKCRGLKPLSIGFSSVYWWEFWNCMEIRHARALFETVTRFELTFEIKSLDRQPCPLKPTSAHWRRGLTRYLKELGTYLPATEHLWLGFDELLIEPRGSQSVRRYAWTTISSLLLRCPCPEVPNLPSLTTLTLENTAVRLDELCNFITRHSQPLRSLTIINMRLSNTGTSSPGILAVVLKLISFLNKETQLDHFSMQGTFLDSDDETRLLCCPKSGTGSILHELEEYVCHRGAFPFHNSEILLQALDTYWPRSGRAEEETVASDKELPRPSLRDCTVEVTLQSDDSWYVDALKTPRHE
ncbi:hypothetical protein AYO21_03947 [Fonsecaea monophora]|uniref:F-box domain-containing protein n=1 Tax=Fonsecaea monophora TaxID=254056 RepID=A0A177FCE5_9EURO|nr:hypothetical protein AYO21_03947 [Fonsecaea monophora]OAG41944.1 hypothetical protein AYO21_03947 [Fonsecaea monophora]